MASQSDPNQAAGRDHGDGLVTRLMDLAGRGDAAAARDLLPLVYDSLRELAARRMAGERVGHTLQATALVHEAYVRLVGGSRGDGGTADSVRWTDRGHFFHAAAQAMRRILIDYARARAGPKRGGGGGGPATRRVELSSVLDLVDAAERDPAEILALDEAISRLEEQSPDAGAVVRLRYFAGLSVEETAQSLGTSERTVHREWAYARAWLYRVLKARAD